VGVKEGFEFVGQATVNLTQELGAFGQAEVGGLASGSNPTGDLSKWGGF